MRVINVRKVTSLPTTKPPEELIAGSVLYFSKESHGGMNAAILGKNSSRPSKLLRDHRIIGPKIIYQSTEGVAAQAIYTIANFDSFTTYTVSVTAGSASRTGDQITVTSPTAIGVIYLCVNGEYSKIRVRAPAVLPSVITYPLAGMSFQNGFTATLSAFTTSGPVDTCLRVEWEAATDLNFSENVLAFTAQGNTPSVALTGLLSGSRYYLRARYVGTTLGNAVWSDPVPFETRLATMATSENAVFSPNDSLTNAALGTSIQLAEDGHYVVLSALIGQTPVVNTGKLYGYRFDGSGWVLVDTVLLPSALSNDASGVSIALSEDGKTLAVGAPRNGTKGTNVGAVYLFKKPENTWLTDTILYPSGVSTTSRFGGAVVMNDTGSHLLIGACDASGQIGKAYVFIRVDGAWTQQTVLSPNDGAALDLFGSSVSLNADASYALIGAPGHQPGAIKTGAAYLYRRIGVVWSLVTKLYYPEGCDQAAFGSAVSVNMDGDLVFIGAPKEKSAGITSGLVFVYRATGSGTWIYHCTIQPTVATVNQNFGGSLSVNRDATRLAVGAENTDDKGALYLIERETGLWTTQVKRVPSVRQTGAVFGHYVVINHTGDLVVVGAPQESGTITHSGKAYLFK